MKIWWLLIPLGVYYVVNNGTVFMGMELLQTVLEKWEPGWQILYLQTLVKMAGMFLGGVAVFSFYKKENEIAKKFTERKELKSKEIIKLIFVGSFFGIGLNMLFSFLAFTQSSENYKRVAESQFSVPLGLAICFYGILSPIVEEIVFRGIIYRSLKRSVGLIMATIGSAFLFGGFHGNIVQMIYGGTMGIVFSCYYEKYGKIMAPILLHGAANIAVYFMIYFA